MSKINRSVGKYKHKYIALSSMDLCLYCPDPLHYLRTRAAQELCESRGDRPGLPVPNSPYGLCGRKATLIDVMDCLLYTSDAADER